MASVLTLFADGVRQGEHGVITIDEEKREEAFNYLVSFLMSFASRSGTRERLHIFTTNYDRFIEAGAEAAGLHLLDRFVGSATAKTQRPLLKRALREVKAGRTGVAEPTEEERKLELRRYLSSMLISIRRDLRAGAIKTDESKFGYRLKAIYEDLESKKGEFSTTDIASLQAPIKAALDSTHNSFKKGSEVIEYYRAFTEAQVDAILDAVNVVLNDLGGLIYQEGLGLMHALARVSGLIEAIDRNVELLAFHFPYHESDHVLNIAYNALTDGRCLEDLELKRNDEAYLDALGTTRIPDPTTAGDFCRRFETDGQINALQRAIDEARQTVWARQPDEFFEQATIDMDDGEDRETALLFGELEGLLRQRAANSRAKKAATTKNGNGANLGFETTMWQAADKLRNNLDAAEYKHVVLGLIFLKYISDAFTELHEKLIAGEGEYEGADPESADEYRAEGVFWVPPEARWSHLQANAKQPTIGKSIDDAMVAIERDNQQLKGVLPKDYARPALDKQRLGELIDLIGTIGLGDKENRSKDILGRVYEYFLSEFASAEGKKGGQFYTPRCVVQTLVEMLAPYKGRVFDPCCGSGGMFVQSEKFVEAHGGRIGDISVYGQESNPTTWKLAQMNLAIRSIEAHLGPHHADSFRNDLHKDLKADYVLANPPFNDSDWGGDALADDVRWKYGTPPKGNANYGWVQHFIHHLAPTGIAGFVLANGSMSSNQSGEGDIRRSIIEADLVDCMVALPGQLFYSTQIPVCLWFLTRDKKRKGFRKRSGETLFIDARKLGQLIDRVHRELTDEEIQRLADTYHVWRGDPASQERQRPGYADIPGFCKSATTEDIKSHGYVLTPGRYVGAEELEEDDEPFDEKMQRLAKTLGEQFQESAKLETAIRRNLAGLGFDLPEAR
eukprot:g26747.t1